MAAAGPVTAVAVRSLGVREFLRLLSHHRVPKTIVIIAGQIAMMAFWQLTRTSISSLRVQVACSMDDIVYTILARGVAYIVGLLLGAAAADWAWELNDLLLALCYLTASLAAFITAFTTSLILLVIALFLNGFVVGCSSILNMSLIIDTWRGRCAVFIYALHLAFGASTQFVYTENIEFYSPSDVLWTNANWTRIVQLSDYPQAPDLVATLTVPSDTWWVTVFTILGAILCVFFVYFLLRHLYKLECFASCGCMKLGYDGQEVRHMMERRDYICTGILSLCYILISGSERILCTQFYTYAMEMGFDAVKAVSLSILFWKCFMSGRFVWLLVSIKVSQVTVLGLSTLLTFIMALLFIIWDESHALLWWGSALLGFGLSAATPGLLAWFFSRDDVCSHADAEINSTRLHHGCIVAAVYFASALGSVLYRLIIPSITQSLHTSFTMYVPLINSALLCLLLAGLVKFDHDIVRTYKIKAKKIYRSIKEDFQRENTEYICYTSGFITLTRDDFIQHMDGCPDLLHC